MARALGYVNINDALRRHCKGVVKRDTLTNGGMQSLSYLPEGDVYRLITHSKIPSAERFESWVFEDVLPSIRKTGGYNMEISEQDRMIIAIVKAPDPVSQAKAIADYTNFVTAPLNQKIAEQQPSVEFANQVADSKNSLLVRDFCKVLQKNGLKIGERKLFRWLMDNGYLMDNKMPYQKYIDYFDVIEHAVTIGDSVFTKYTTRITGKGQVYFTQKILDGNRDCVALIGA